MNEIKDEISLLFSDLKMSKLYKDYVKVKENLKNNSEITTLIKDIKRMQKIATNNKDVKIEKDLKKMYDKLYSIPLYQSYLIIKEELEETLYMISDNFDKYFKSILFIDIN